MSISHAELNAQLTAPGALFEIEEQEIRGIPTRIWKHAPPSLRAVLESSRAHGDKTFIVYEDERYTFEEHFRRAAWLAQSLVGDWGVKKGDRVAIAMRNFPEWAIAFWATTSVGGIVVPLNSWWKGEELEYGLSDSGARILFADAKRAEILRPHMANLSIDHTIITRDDDAAGDHLRFEDVMANIPDDVALPDVNIDPEDDATIFYTSGTTGNPKGALGTHRNICGNLLSLAFGQARAALRSGKTLESLTEGGQHAQLISVPLFHATGCHAILVANTAFGGKLVMMYKWDPELALELIEREAITAFGGVPAMVWQVLESPDFGKRDLSSVRGVGYGGAPAAPELVRRIKEEFPEVSPANGYGLTETSSVTTLNAGDDYIRKPESCGTPVPVVELKVIDPDGVDLGIDAVGELLIKGPNVVKEYWNKPEATAESFTDGWLHSGDLAKIDYEGFVYIVDRVKDMVIRAGENIYCVEVESVLYDHPDVVDAAVVGLPHKVLGEEVGAVVQLRSGAQVDAAELRSHVSARLAGFKVPVRIEIRNEPLPRNANGKILKSQLRDEMAAQLVV